ncbi:thioredoxin domain-containing protein [Hoyosella rhizosphaerae]|nr:thioredoxin domain-containing protein [Hoyosella rhizosphaerae]MBN4925674.1 thioredoxin domain-containing protein [Hoyosella rhizosphaerae]
MHRNVLGDASSPYLRQHADNPVHWQEWGAEALDWAKSRDVPILLSVGYASCHWCHVMAHESFEDAATADIMNEHFVCIKVDREERPDIDAVYMNATQAMTGQGGWPMTCFLTPSGEPFYCGTYYPSQPRGGMPTFTQLLGAINDTWANRRDEVHHAASAVTEALQRNTQALPETERSLSPELLNAAASRVIADEDIAFGGFGAAPKFPPAAIMEALLRHYERTGNYLETVERTAEAMARGGIYDQLAGGFSRYSVDAEWVVPHFEKMLYDNALLLRAYAHLARVTSSPLATRIATETAEFLLHDLRTEHGGFASAFDADTEGVEGLTYVWTSQELIDTLGLEDGMWAASLFDVGTTGTFEGRTSVLQLPEDPDDFERFDRVRNTLLSHRNTRPQPERDDKVVTAWNGLAITALVESGLAFNKPTWIAAAETTAKYLLDQHLIAGRLRRSSLDGTVGAAAGVLEDYAALAVGLLALFQATGNDTWRREAENLIDTALVHFSDPNAEGSWFDSADDADALITRPRDPLDGATPSGASTLTEALLALSVVTDPAKTDQYAAAASRSLARAVVALQQAPRSAGHWFAVAEAAQHGPLQVVVSATDDSPGDALVSDARRSAPGGAIVVAAEVDSTPLLHDRPPVDGHATAYVCRGFVCDTPRTTQEGLRQALST